MTFGIVVEAERDANVYSTLIQRIRSDVGSVLRRPCGGFAGVRDNFVGWLKNFQWHSPLVDKALVIVDSDRSNPVLVERELDSTFEKSKFQPSFAVHFYATRSQVETWLLADENAVSSVARQRQKTASAQAVAGPLEDIPDAKQLFLRMLSQARLPADPAVYAEVASAADMDRIAERCPRFRQFKHRVHAC